MTTIGPWETSTLSDGTQWQVCEEGAGDYVADCRDEDTANLIKGLPDLINALEAVLPHAEQWMAELGNLGAQNSHVRGPVTAGYNLLRKLTGKIYEGYPS